MELIAKLTDPDAVAAFLLMFARIGGIMAFFPYFTNTAFPVSVKTTLSFYICILLFPNIPEVHYNFRFSHIWIGILGEVMFGFLASMFIQILFAIIHFAGETISFSMGFSMASAFDPTSGVQNNVIAQLLTITATLFLLDNGFDHLILLFFNKSLELLPLGGFLYEKDITTYIIKAFATIFLFGFTLAFPIVGLVLLADIIFGMIMKTNPQFNLLVFGFPIKIFISFVALILIVKGFLVVVLNYFNDLFDKLQLLLV